MRKVLLALLAAALLLTGLLQPPASFQSRAQTPKKETPKKEAPPAPLKIKVGSVAPDFTLLAFDGKELKKVSLSDYRGKKNVALAFYVFAFTGGWTKEMKAFQQNLEKLEAADTQVLGVSMDSPFSNFHFASQNGITFPLLGDWGGKVTRAYGLSKEYDINGVKMQSARRATFLIDKEGKVVETQVDSDAVDPTKTVEACERRKLKSWVFSPRPIGYVRSPYRDTKDVPKGLGAKHEAEGTLELLPEFEGGLKDIEGFSHLIVLWEFHRAQGYELEGTPPCDDRSHGVFATRSPYRPNPIGLTVVELLGRDGPRLRVRGLDMLDGTPILDLKPYLSSIPEEKLRRGWLAEAEARKSGR